MIILSLNICGLKALGKIEGLGSLVKKHGCNVISLEFKKQKALILRIRGWLKYGVTEDLIMPSVSR